MYCVLCHFSLVEVHCQTFPYVSFMDQTLANHSYVDLSLMGRLDIPPGSNSRGQSVECHYDVTMCCRRSDGIHRGEEVFP